MLEAQSAARLLPSPEGTSGHWPRSGRAVGYRPCVLEGPGIGVSAARGRKVTVWALAFLAWLAQPRTIRAHQDPSGCQGFAAVLNLAPLSGDGALLSSEKVSPCETFLYKGSVSFSADACGPSSCCTFEGGRLIITTPHDEPVDATPEGGIPKLGGEGGVRSFDSLPIEFTVTKEDAAKGTLFASISYTGGIAHTSASDQTNLPVQATAIVTQIQPCPLRAPCVTFVCDKQKIAGSRRGVCSVQTEPQPRGTPCPFTDGNPCTTGRCDGAGACDRSPQPCDDGDPCTSDRCTTAGCQHDQVPDCPRCGDGTMQGVEECDEGSKNGALDSCCDAKCKLRRSTYICRFAASACQLDADCRDSKGPCPPNHPAPSDRICDDGNPCTAGDHCDTDVGMCVSPPNGTVCDATVEVKPARGRALPRLEVDCMGAPILRGAFCDATAFLGVDFASPAACHPDESGRIPVTKARRRSLKAGSVSLVLPLNRCGRRLYRGLAAGTDLQAVVQVNLGGIVTGDPNLRAATFNSMHSIMKR